MEYSADDQTEQHSYQDGQDSIASGDTLVPRSYDTVNGSSEGDEDGPSPRVKNYIYGQASQDVYTQQDYDTSGAMETKPDGSFSSLEGAEAWRTMDFSGDRPFVGPDIGSSSSNLPDDDYDVYESDSISRRGSLSLSDSSLDTLSSAELSPQHQQKPFFGDPSQSGLSLELPCMFEAINMCTERPSAARKDEAGWIIHIKQHLKHRYPPMCTCPFCLDKFPKTLQAWPDEIWDGREWTKERERSPIVLEEYLRHIAEHFRNIDYPEGSRWVLDFDILRFLLGRNLISDDNVEAFRQLYYTQSCTLRKIYGSPEGYFTEPAPQDQYEDLASQEEAAEIGRPLNAGNWSERNEAIHREDKGKAKDKGKGKGKEKEKEKEKEKGKSKNTDKGKGKGVDKDKDKDRSKKKDKDRR